VNGSHSDSGESSSMNLVLIHQSFPGIELWVNLWTIVIGLF